MKFTATEWDTAEQKEKFVKHFKKFVEKGMPLTWFSAWFYNRLSNTFGHIAHCNRGGFYHVWFATKETQLSFLRHTLKASICGDPACTYSDAERAIQSWLSSSGIVDKLDDECMKEERVERHKAYVALKAEFEPEGAVE